jgi:hypothetical protein
MFIVRSLFVWLMVGIFSHLPPRSLVSSLSLYDERVNKQASASDKRDRQATRKESKKATHASSAFEIILFYHCAF